MMNGNHGFRNRFFWACLALGLLPFILHPSAFSITPPCFPTRPVAIDHWRGEYFNNRELTGAPTMVRDDGAGDLDFDWGLGSPSAECGVAADEFSARWTRTIPFAAGAYRFTITSDDGVRLRIDGQERFANWTDHAVATQTVEVALAAGNHKVTLEYYDRWGSARVRLSWESHPCLANVPPDHWRGEFFSNLELKGQPVAVRDEGERASLLFEPNDQSPDAACGVPQWNYSARWTRKPTFAQGLYRFNLASNGGARVYIDGALRADAWASAGGGRTSFELRLESGNHLVTVEYRTGPGRARVALDWKPLPCAETVPESRWRGEYFNTDNLTGPPVMVRDDGENDTLEFNWGEDSPGALCGVNRDRFSVRWTRIVPFTKGTYRFIVAGNDAVRFYIDGALKLDQWREQSARFLVDVEMAAGTHKLTLEYADFGGTANVKLAWQPPPCIEAVPADHWRGEFFDNPDLRGRPVVVRDDGAGGLHFDWGLAAPNPGCSSRADAFSARWTRTTTFAAGVYRFAVAGDDGFRLFVDGRKALDEWRDQPFTARAIDLELAAGKHTLVLEYFDRIGSAAVQFSWTPAPCTAVVPVDRWRGEYFNNPALDGRPAMTRDDGAEALRFDWGLKSPDASCGLNADNFSARWTRVATFREGLYRFQVAADDGVRVYVDRQLKFERWTEQAASHSFDLPMSAGNHQIVVEYYERFGSALLQFRWDRHPCFADVPPDRWRGEYFNNRMLTGAPAMIRDDGEGGLNFDWGPGSPSAECKVNADDFSVRWTRKAIFPAGWHRFSVTADDGIRLYVDGKRLIDQWRNQLPTPLNADVLLTAGSHRIVVEYYDHTGGATARVGWEPIPGPSPDRRAAGVELRTARP